MPLTERLKQFKELDYEINKERYLSLQRNQSPHTLFIGCSDSRVNAESLLQARPGEVFHLRNIANIIHPIESVADHPSNISTIEYGVVNLGVENIVVCGHSNCGGCAALMHLEDYQESNPYTYRWLEPNLAVVQTVKEAFPERSEEEQLLILEQFNAVSQLSHLMTYDFVRQRVEEGSLQLHAFYYDIGSGSIFQYKYSEATVDLLDLIQNWA